MCQENTTNKLNNKKLKQVEIDRANGFRICTKCNVKKELTHFSYSKSQNFFYSKCKNCSKRIDRKRYNLTNPFVDEFRIVEIDNIPHKKCRKCKISKPLDNFRLKKERHIARCKECEHMDNVNFYHNNKEKCNAKSRKSFKKKLSENPDFYKIRYQKRKQDIVYMKKKKIQERERKRRKSKNDINYRIIGCLRARINRALKGKDKSDRTINLLGCSIEFFITYIESKFLPGMTWKNHGNKIKNWQIDHIIPCTAFNLIHEEEQRRCFHYTNLQPLWGKDNLIKGDKLPNGTRARDLKHDCQLLF